MRSFQRGLKRKSLTLIKKLRKAVREAAARPQRRPPPTRWHGAHRYFCVWRAQKKEAVAGEKPDPVRTHLRDMVIVPEMIGSVIGVYNGKTFNQVEIKVRRSLWHAPRRAGADARACASQPEMVGTYTGEYSISYKPVKHGRPGIGATHSSRFIPLK